MTTWLAALPLPDHDCCILDTHIGDAHRFLSAWHHWRLKPDAKGVLRFIAVSSELKPQALEQALPQLPSNLAPLASQFLAQWPLPLPGLHQLTLDNGRLELTLVLSPPLRSNPLNRIQASCDFIWAPHSSTTPNAAHLARLANSGTVLWSDGADRDAALRFERALIGAGFTVVRTAEHPTEISASFRGTRTRNIGFHHSVAQSREALVVGAGLAGTAAAAGLARRGWKVTVLERHALPAQGASGNLAAVLSPMLSKDDGLAAQLSRSSFLHLLKELRTLAPTTASGLWEPCGKLQIARNAKEEDSFQELIHEHQYPKEYVQFLTRSAASNDLGHPVAAGALLFPEGGWVNPRALCEARRRSSPNIEMRGGQGVLDITYANDQWQASGALGVQLGHAPVLILANAYEAQEFAPARQLHLKKVRGQVTHIPSDTLPLFH
ncbi:MAG: FAD-dependent 5-carboxymethylaminomethyl-2-thiouridine(34) oxidoreductase MnmC, partial [Verrucomicrobiota bacterium]